MAAPAELQALVKGGRLSLDGTGLLVVRVPFEAGSYFCKVFGSYAEASPDWKYIYIFVKARRRADYVPADHVEFFDRGEFELGGRQEYPPECKPGRIISGKTAQALVDKWCPRAEPVPEGVKTPSNASLASTSEISSYLHDERSSLDGTSGVTSYQSSLTEKTTGTGGVVFKDSSSCPKRQVSRKCMGLLAKAKALAEADPYPVERSATRSRLYRKLASLAFHLSKLMKGKRILLPQRALATLYGVDQKTVSNAIDWLVQKGLLACSSSRWVFSGPNTEGKEYNFVGKVTT